MWDLGTIVRMNELAAKGKLKPVGLNMQISLPRPGGPGRPERTQIGLGGELNPHAKGNRNSSTAKGDQRPSTGRQGNRFIDREGATESLQQ